VTALGGGCVKTPLEIFCKKIDRIEQPTSYDRPLGNGFGTPNFFANLLEFEFLHRLGTLLTLTSERNHAFQFLMTASWHCNLHPPGLKTTQS
jgi:hypothetical protein